MGTIIMREVAIVKFFEAEEGYGFASTKKFGDVRVAGAAIGTFSGQLVKGAEVDLSFYHQVHKGKEGYNASKIHSVTAPKVKSKPEPMIVLSTVDWFDPGKGFGFVSYGVSKKAFLHVSVCEKASFLPSPGDVLKVTLGEGAKGPKVVYFDQGDAVDREWADLMGVVHPEDGAVGEEGDTSEVDVFAPLFGGGDIFEQHAAETMAELGQQPAETQAVVEPSKPKRQRTKKSDADKPKGKVTGKSGGIPSSKDYGVHQADQPIDLADVVLAHGPNGGGTMACAMFAATGK